MCNCLSLIRLEVYLWFLGYLNVEKVRHSLQLPGQLWNQLQVSCDSLNISLLFSFSVCLYLTTVFNH